MKDVVIDKWRNAATAFLLGSHDRLGASSVVKRLPSVILLRILSAAKVDFYTKVSVEIGMTSQSRNSPWPYEADDEVESEGEEDVEAEQEAPQQTTSTFHGDDLAFIAALL